MKRIVTFLLVISMALSLMACGLSFNKDSANSEAKFGDLEKVPHFKLVDLNGKEYTDDIFKDKKLTLINIWGTFCGPCIKEMPDLQTVYKEYVSKDVNIIGIISDGKKDEAKEILKKANVQFVNLLPDEEFEEEFVSKTTGVPTTLFVNSTGEIIDVVVGAKDKEEYKNLIDSALEDIKIKVKK